MTTIDCIKELFEQYPEIEKLRVFEFSFSNKAQERLKELSNEEKQILNESINFKKENGISFWEAFFRVSIQKNEVHPRLMKQALHHNSNSDYSNMSISELISFIDKNENKNLAINSQVELSDGRLMHIPMLDFKIKSDKKNLPLVHEIIIALGLTGKILDSGKSYHFFGNKLLNAEKFYNILAKFILFHPVSDKSWAAHQLIEGSASLRVTSKNGFMPKVVATV